MLSKVKEVGNNFSDSVAAASTGTCSEGEEHSLPPAESKAKALEKKCEPLRLTGSVALKIKTFL